MEGSTIVRRHIFNRYQAFVILGVDNEQAVVMTLYNTHPIYGYDEPSCIIHMPANEAYGYTDILHKLEPEVLINELLSIMSGHHEGMHDIVADYVSQLLISTFNDVSADNIASLKKYIISFSIHFDLVKAKDHLDKICDDLSRQRLSNMKASMIQSAWRNAWYNPEIKLCKMRLKREFEELCIT